MEKSGVVAAHNMFQQAYSNLAKMAPNSAESSLLSQSFIVAQNFYRAMAGLAYLSSFASYGSKFKVPTTNLDLIQKQLCWLAGLVVFGPTSIFTSCQQEASNSNTMALVDLGASILKDKMHRDPEEQLPRGVFDNLHRYFLDFLCRMGFTDLDSQGVPKVNWQQVHKQFHIEFSIQKLSDLFCKDIEIALADPPSN